MEEKKLNELNELLSAMDLPFAYPLVEALVRDDLAGRGENSDDLTTRIYGLAGSVPPGKDAPLRFEQLIFDLFKEHKASFDKAADQEAGELRTRLLALFDKWMLLYDFLQEDEHSELPGMDAVTKELEDLLNFVQNLLNRLNHPENEESGALSEIDFLTRQSEDVLVRIMERIDEILHPRVAEEEEAGESVLTLKISLTGLPVWRRIRISNRINLAQFHAVLQKAMGWWDLYNHQFEQAGKFWGAKTSETATVLQEEECLLSALLEEEDDLLHYYYDLSEVWHHKIVVEKTQSPEKGQTGVVLECIAGEGACPPEDCGGPEGFRMLLASLKPDATQALKDDFSWVGDFNPESFSLTAVNKELKELL